jgi:hypothetical protein
VERRSPFNTAFRRTINEATGARHELRPFRRHHRDIDHCDVRVDVPQHLCGRPCVVQSDPCLDGHCDGRSHGGHHADVHAADVQESQKQISPSLC